MSNVLIGIIGVILFIGLALAGALFLGDQFAQSKNKSEAARLIAEGSQISHAFELYGLQEGAYPDAATSDGKIDQLVSTGYLKSVPVGAKQTAGFTNSWYIDETKGAALTYIGDDKTAESVCITAREQLGFTGTPKLCTASDIADNDPCCIAA